MSRTCTSLTKAEIAELKSSFEAMDTNQNGVLERSEMENFARLNGMDTHFIKLLFVMFDKDKNGSISFIEFKRYIKTARIMDTDPKAFFKLVFEAIDSDRSGVFTAAELMEFCDVIDQPCTQEEADAAIAAMDLTSSKSVTFLEVWRWLKRSHK